MHFFSGRRLIYGAVIRSWASTVRIFCIRCLRGLVLTFDMLRAVVWQTVQMVGLILCLPIIVIFLALSCGGHFERRARTGTQESGTTGGSWSTQDHEEW